MTGPIPIRSEVTPKFDGEREVIDFCALRVREFAFNQGHPPTRVVMVLMGKDASGQGEASTTSFWDTMDTRTRSEMRGHAAVLLLREPPE